MLWGVTQAVGFAFRPIMEDLAKDAAKDWAKDLFKERFNKVLHLLDKDPLRIAAGKALKEFLQLVQEELQNAKITQEELQQYIQPLKQFINDKSVKKTLGSAFNEDCQYLDVELAQAWNELKLLALPNDFDWLLVGKLYQRKVKAIILESPELRNLFDSQNLQAAQESLQEIAGISPDFDLKKYQEGIQEQYGNLRLDSLDTDGSAYNQLKLWRIFIEQNVREVREILPQVHEIPKDHQRRLRESNQLEAEMSLEELERFKQAYYQQSIRPILETIHESITNNYYTVVLGDPGSGKSTFLQYIALDWAELPVKELALKPLPLLIELRTYIRNRDAQQCKDFLGFFHQSSGAICHLNQHELHERLKAGKAIVMFDGLDEVFEPGKREDLITDIIRFTNEYPQVGVVVTSRPIGYKPQRLRDANFRHFMLQDLEAEQIAEFIHRWHDLTFNNEVDKTKKRERLQTAINSSRAIRELAGNPLLLTMMAILNRNQELPRDRPELYNQSSRLLLHQWDVERELVEDEKLDPKTIDYKDKQAMLRQVAYRMQANEKGLAGNLISAENLEDILTDYLKKKEFSDARDKARRIIHQLRTRNFILCFLGADYYAFVHRTFLEYFCAWEFVWQFEKTQNLTIAGLIDETFGKHWQDESWQEVLCLIAGMIEAKFVGEILEYLMAQDGEKEKFINLFLAAKCLSEVRNRTGIVPTATQLLNRLKGLTKYDLNYYYEPYSPEYEKETHLVYEIRTKSVVAVATVWQEDSDTLTWLQAHAQSDNSSTVRRAAVQEIARGWQEHPDTLPMLQARAQSDDNWAVRQAAVQELARGWKEHPDTLPILQACVQSDDDFNVRSAAVEELARGWQEHPDTLPILQALVQSDDDSSVRCVTVQQLARGWKEHPDTLPILQAHAQSDDDHLVRRGAVQELARGWKEHPDTLPILQARAQSDDDSSVRCVIVQELARGWKEHPDTLPILQARAQSDDDSSVRCVIVQELARGWKEHPDTLPILQARAQSDDNWAVRRGAVQELARGWKEHPDTLPILQARAQSDNSSIVRQAAVQELARGWQEHLGTLPMLQARAQSDNSSIVRQAAVQELARGWKEHPDTLPMLQARVQSDDDSDVRRAAVEEIARGWKEHPDTLPMLQARVQSDDDSDVRRAAVEEIARGWKDNPGMREFLGDRAINDPFIRKHYWEDNPRQIALAVIVKQYPHHPQTLSLLRDRASNDPDEKVREFANESILKYQERSP
jgi:predicted NACHT family NTPase